MVGEGITIERLNSRQISRPALMLPTDLSKIRNKEGLVFPDIITPVLVYPRNTILYRQVNQVLRIVSGRSRAPFTGSVYAAEGIRR